MRSSPLIFAALISAPAVLYATGAAADEAPPPAGSKPLSQILSGIEQSPNFRNIDEAEFEDGSYKIEYYTKDGSKHKILIDPATGKPRPPL